MRKYQQLIILSLLASKSLLAQIPSDALLGTDFQPFGTARSTAVGHAMGAIGGDFSSISINPAGLGVYRVSELTLSSQFSNQNLQTTFNQVGSQQNANKFRLNQVGAVFSVPDDKDTDNSGFNFALGYQVLNVFDRSFDYDGTTFGSRIPSMVASANGNTPGLLNPYENGLAYDAFLIDLDNSGSGITYVGALTDSNFVRKTQSVRQTGQLADLGMGISSNIGHRFFLGAALGIPLFRYRDNRNYRELEETGLIDFKEMRFEENREVRGTGVNFKLGLIYKLTQGLRLGFHVHTPTLYRLIENKSSIMYGEVVFDDTLRRTELASPNFQFRHNLYTPTVLGLSLAYVGPSFFLSADGEWINYSRSRFAVMISDSFATEDDRAFMREVSLDVRAAYQSSYRLRLGMEIVLADFRLRAGYRLQTSPFKTAVPDVSDTRRDLSFGLGYRNRSFFMDFTYLRSLQEFEFQPYTAASELGIQRVIGQDRLGTFMLTLGYRFGHRD